MEPLSSDASFWRADIINAARTFKAVIIFFNMVLVFFEPIGVRWDADWTDATDFF